LKHISLKELCYLGGWKEPQTVLKCYQQPDELTMRGADEPPAVRGQVVFSARIDTTNRHHESTPRPQNPSQEEDPLST
jgi:hypothetical protein